MNLARLPVGEMIIGFLVAAIVVTFVFAFNATGGGSSSTSSSSPSASATAGSATPGGGGGGALAVTATDNAFDPTTLTVKAGASVAITLTNKGTATHNLRVAGPDGKFNTDDDAVSDPQIVAGGQTATVSLQAPAQAASLDYQCDFHPGQMKGTITVQ